MQTGVANSVTSTFVNVPWYSLLHRLTPAPLSPMQSASFVQAKPVVPSVTADVIEASVPPSSKRWKIPPLLALVPLEAPPLAVHVSPFGQEAELEQPDTKAIESPTAVNGPKNIERISFLLDPRFRATTNRRTVARPRRLYPDARVPISQVTVRPTKSRVNQAL
jgi:hypothetical protein